VVVREAVQVAAAAEDVVVADRACGANRAIETQKEAAFMVASVGKEKTSA
jgi:hypothetical protein